MGVEQCWRRTQAWLGISSLARKHRQNTNATCTPFKIAQKNKQHGIAILLMKLGCTSKYFHDKSLQQSYLNQQNSNAMLFLLLIKTFNQQNSNATCTPIKIVRRKQTSQQWYFADVAWRKKYFHANLLIRIAAKIIMEIFACAPSLISKIAMLCCLVCMWHCYFVDQMSLAAAKKTIWHC